MISSQFTVPFFLCGDTVTDLCGADTIILATSTVFTESMAKLMLSVERFCAVAFWGLIIPFHFGVHLFSAAKSKTWVFCYKNTSSAAQCTSLTSICLLFHLVPALIEKEKTGAIEDRGADYFWAILGLALGTELNFPLSHVWLSFHPLKVITATMSPIPFADRPHGTTLCLFGWVFPLSRPKLLELFADTSWQMLMAPCLLRVR